MRKKTYASQALAVILLFAVFLAACTGGSGGGSEGEAAPTPGESSAEPAAPPTPTKSPEEYEGEVVFYNYIYYEPLVPSYDKLIADFNKVYPNIKVRIVLGPPGQFTNMIAAGDPPDLTNWSWVNIPWVEDNLIEDLTPYQEKDGIDPGIFFQPAQDMFSHDGKMYGMPWFLGVNSVLGYNRKVFDQYGMNGLPGMNTLEELGELYGKFWILNNGEYEMTGENPFGYGSWLQLWDAAYLNGADQNTVYNPETRKVAMNDPLIVEALEWMVEFKREHIQDEALARLNQAMPDQSFYGRMAGGKQALGIVTTGVIKDTIAPNPNLDFGYQAMPDHGLWLFGHGISMLTAGKNKEAAWEFLKWLTTTQEGSASIGTHFNNFSGLVHNEWAIEQAEKDEAIKVFVDAMGRAEKTPPVMPADYVPEFTALYPQVMSGQMGAKEFLDHMTAHTQQLVDDFYNKQ